MNEYCRPEFVDLADGAGSSSTGSSSAFLEIVGGRHPTVEVNTDAEFIPNDIVLGKETAATATAAAAAAAAATNTSADDLLLLLAGPNMGGKSTLLRQVTVPLVSKCK
jgi:DNA mismatch repair ATPase MutS